MVRLPKIEQDAEEWLMYLGENVRKLRMKRGLSQGDLASACNVSYPRISEIERGVGNPTVRTLKLIADKLDVDLSALFRAPRRNSKKTSALA